MSQSNAAANPKRVLPLVIGAIGVVFGDIGTSPLYTVQGGLRQELRPGTGSGQRARHPVAGVLVDDAGDHGQVRHRHHARRQPRRRRHPGADGGGAAQPADRLAADLRHRPARHLRHRLVLRRRRADAGDLGALGGRGPGRGGAVAGPITCVPVDDRRAGAACSRSSATAWKDRQDLRADDGGVVPGDGTTRRRRRCSRIRRCCRRSIRGGRCSSSCTTACVRGWRWARWCLPSPAARRCTRTWVTSDGGRFASPGCAWCLPAWCSTTSARAR